MAEEVGDKETAKVARAIRRDEERMAKYLEGLIPTLTKAVAKTEIPAAERSTNGGRRRRSKSSSKSASGKRATASTKHIAQAEFRFELLALARPQLIRSPLTPRRS